MLLLMLSFIEFFVGGECPFYILTAFTAAEAALASLFQIFILLYQLFFTVTKQSHSFISME